MNPLGHFRGVRFGKGVIHFGQTRTDIRIDMAFVKNAIAVAKINAVISWRRLTRRKSAYSLAFTPQIPGPWYNARYAGHLAGLRFAADIRSADCVFVFDDKTHSDAGKQHVSSPSINAHIADISKTHVADVFEQIFGYSVGVDPMTYDGRAVQKSDTNATHAGQIVNCPLNEAELVQGCVYQKLIDSTPNGLQSEEMRVAYVGGEIPAVFYKFKDLEKRFSTVYARVDVREAKDVFSVDEIKMLNQFCAAMGLDFGALDVLRDKNDGRIYVIDVNKTCMPVLSLPIKEQMRSLDKIGQSLLRLVVRLSSECS